MLPPLAGLPLSGLCAVNPMMEYSLAMPRVM